MDTQAVRTQSRLEPVKTQTLAPFVRATAIDDISVYWVPVADFPMLPFQREWLREFHRRLAVLLSNTKGLRQECFLQFKSLYPDLLDRFTEASSEYIPMTGCSLVPGTTPQAAPDFSEVKAQIERASKHGEPVDVNRWMPDHLHWFAAKKPELQRDSFFGHGGMLTLYLAPDADTIAPVLDLPKVVTTHPGYSDTMLSDIQTMYSLRDAFLAKSKSVFGEPFRKSAAYNGLLFILPLLSGNAFVQATAEERATWFEVFSGYFVESKADQGMILAVNERNFDEDLIALISGMEDDGFVYRS